MLMARSKPDVRSLGRSSVVPYVEGEDPMLRHERRRKSNLAYADILSKWCKENGWDMAIKSEGHHWIFNKGKMHAEWWPSSAKLVMNMQYNAGYHCHDYLQVEKTLLDQGS